MKASTFAMIRKVASIVLALCFVLPLCRCSLQQANEGHVIADNTYVFAFDIVKDGWTAITTGDFVDGLHLPVAILVFFVPALCLRFGERLQTFVHIFGTPISEFYLFYWVLVISDRPQIGGLLAMLCWFTLFCAGCTTLFRR